MSNRNDIAGEDGIAGSRAYVLEFAATTAHADASRSRPVPMKLKALPLSRVYRLIEPGPVVLLVTAASKRRGGRPNVMTMSWHMMVEFEPPLVACIVSNRNHSFAALRATRECVIALPARRLAATVVKIGNCSGRDIDKFAAFGLTALPAKRVAPPLIGDCFANLECRVVDTRMVARYCLFVLEVVAAWTDPAQKNPKTIHHHGYGRFVIDGPVLRLPSRMR
jgi:flavin reductase (DIM6/NTAB) family NADH-FMN oxidoreductase RutF